MKYKSSHLSAVLPTPKISTRPSNNNVNIYNIGANNLKLSGLICAIKIIVITPMITLVNCLMTRFKSPDELLNIVTNPRIVIIMIGITSLASIYNKVESPEKGFLLPPM